MSEMPERIWAWGSTSNGFGVGCSQFFDCVQPDHTEYVRADLVAEKDAEIERLKKALSQLLCVVDMRYDGCFGVDATDPTMVWGMLWEDGQECVWHDSECPELAAYLRERDNRPPDRVVQNVVQDAEEGGKTDV